MMRSNNSSQTSLASTKDKDLPPVPAPQSPSQPQAAYHPLHDMSSSSRESSYSNLHRSANCTSPARRTSTPTKSTHPYFQLQQHQQQHVQNQLSSAGSDHSIHSHLASSIQSHPEPPITDTSIDSQTSPPDDHSILQTKTLKRKNFKKLSLDSNLSASTTTAPSESNIPAPLVGTAARPQGIKIRPAPLLNLGATTNNTKVNHNSGNIGSLNINRSNRNVDPDSQTSRNLIINQLDKLDLNNSSNSPTSVKPQHAQRKRQTVISSISPTKSNAPSPSDDANHTHPSLEDSLRSFNAHKSPNANQSKNQSRHRDSHSNSPVSTTSSIKLDNNDLVTLKNLGSGNSGTVSKILHIPTQKTMAKKIIHIDSKTVIQTQIIRELRILHECQSPYIIEFYGAFINNNNTIVICMEYCNCGSLDKVLELCQPKQFPLPVLKKLSYAVLSGLCYLYTNHKIIHRDIKPSNVLMTHKGEFKLCDFGVSRELTNSLAMADTFVGTSTYMSPERIQGLNYGIKSDIWSMGLMLIELASGKSIWANKGPDEEGEEDDDDIPAGPEGILDLLQRIVNETPPSLTNRINPTTGTHYDAQLCQFIDSCLIKDDNLRKSPWDLLDDKSGYLKGVEQGLFDKDVKAWAKKVRKLHKEKYEQSSK